MQDKSVTITNFLTVEDLQNVAASIPARVPKDTPLTIVFDDQRITLKDEDSVVISHIKRGASQPNPQPRAMTS